MHCLDCAFATAYFNEGLRDAQGEAMQISPLARRAADLGLDALLEIELVRAYLGTETYMLFHLNNRQNHTALQLKTRTDDNG